MSRSYFSNLIYLFSSVVLFFSHAVFADPLEEIVKNFTSKLNLKSEYSKMNVPKLCFDDEKKIMQIDSSLVLQMRRKLLGLDKSDSSKETFEKFKKLGPSSKVFKSSDQIFEFEWSEDEANNFTQRLEKFSKIESAEIRIEDYKIDEASRIGEGEFNAIVLKLKLDIRAHDKGGNKTQDVFLVSAQIKLENKNWKIVSVELINGRTYSVNRPSKFVEITKNAGLENVNIEPRKHLRNGQNVSVLDLNGDGFVDLIFHHNRTNKIYLYNKKNEKYDPANQSNVADFFMLTEGRTSEAKTYSFLNDAEFSESSVAAADFNGDKKIELIGENYFKKTKNSFVDQIVNFKDFNKNENSDHFKITYDSSLKLQSSLAADLDLNNKIDVVGVDQRGNLKYLFKNLGNDKFLVPESDLAVVSYNYASQINSADINNDGHPDVIVTDINFSEFNRINTACMRHYSLSIFGMDNVGLKVYLGRNGQFKQTSLIGLEDVGEAVASTAVLDYNNDGLLDLYISNGLWSGDPQGQQVGPFFVAAKRGGRIPVSDIIGADNALGFYEFLKTDKGVLSDFLGATDKSSEPRSPSLAGFQRNRLFRNNGDGTFTDVAYLEGVDSLADGFSVISLDYDNDGATDLLLSNSNAISTEKSKDVIQLFKNTSATQQQSVTFKLDNLTLLKAASGLRAIAHTSKGRQLYIFNGFTNSSNSQKIIHFGLGKNKKFEKIEFFWADGSKKVLKDVNPGIYNLQ